MKKILIRGFWRVINLITGFDEQGDNGTNIVIVYDDGFDIDQVDTSSIVRGDLLGNWGAGTTFKLLGDSSVTAGSFKIGQSQVNGGNDIIVDSLPVILPMTSTTNTISIYRAAGGVHSTGSFRNLVMHRIA